MKLISACLCGVNCKYNGKNNIHAFFGEMLSKNELLPVCPEQLGGLCTPRPPCEIVGGNGNDVLEKNAWVTDTDSKDLSLAFIKGAEETLQIATAAGITEAIFQSRSPSCGCGQIYDGTFTSNLIPGDGVTAALLKRNGINVINDVDFLQSYGR